MFTCDKCGLCCMGLEMHEDAKDMHNGDGICYQLDRETMLCKIYDHRPIFCQVDGYYDKYLTDKMTREEYYERNREACELKKKEWREKGTLATNTREFYEGKAD